MAHALLAPSSASRWLACPPSARLEEQFPDKDDDFTKEGDLAHSLAAVLLKERMSFLTTEEAKRQIETLSKNEHYNEAMLEYCEDYVLFVWEKFVEAQQRTSDARIFIEHRLDMSQYVPEGFGTGDVIILADKIMDTVDFKYGRGHSVDIRENEQQKLYALGALSDFDFQFDISSIRMSVYQPRIGNIVSWETSVDDLLKWAREILAPKAQLAFDGKGEYVPGQHCQFCKARVQCKVLAERNLEVLHHQKASPDTLSDQELLEIFNISEDIKTWLNKVEDYILNKALNGKQWPGYKLVEGRSVRKYSDIDKVAETLKGAGFDEAVLYKKELLTITNMEKAVGKKQFETLVGPLLIKPPGKPTLVPASDKRPAYNSTATAVADFSQQ